MLDRPHQSETSHLRLRPGRERAASPLDVPSSIARQIAGRGWARDTIGEAGAAVYRLYATGPATAAVPDLYLKHGGGDIATDIFNEAARLRWLAKHVAVPVVRQMVVIGNDEDGEEGWLLMDALRGDTAHQLLVELDGDLDSQTAVVDALVAFLRRLHAIPPELCPFISDHHRRLVHAQMRLDAGLIDIDDFGEDREGWTAQQVWEAIQALLPLTPDSLVTHGDYSLDNVLIEREPSGAFTVVGCIDVGRVGIADRYQDLAILWDCLGEFDARLRERMISRYGITQVDERKLQFHLLLDECF